MMATEVHEDRSVEASVIPDSEPITKIHDDSENVDSNAPSVNGAAASVSPDELENKHISDIVDDLVNSAEASISGGSDTEASRADPFKGKDDDKGHVRTSSAVRKPATFKSVSVNKTFLAAKAATGTTPSKIGDKPGSAAVLASAPSAAAASSARPRLVAKTGSGLGNSFARSAAGANGGRPAAAPDPNAVWNKNRPVPPPEPKKFTDEELKKYGIHMATRLQQDDARGQANWADIDDDDEDWAPEEIRWTDGTKSTIPHPDENPAPSPVPAVVSLAKEVHPIEKPKSPAPSVSPSVKPGTLPSGKGLVLKGAAEKPTLVAKPPAPPTPVKSPWASLPPVEKASPAAADLQQSSWHHGSRGPPRDFHGPPGELPPHFKEIAADDFSRSGFRDGHQHPNRELFNSQSGRLEPVTDRRGGMRSDSYSRQPPAALLQRPSHSDHPEPSAAFQTHRSSGQEAPYGRRRGSSNVSGGSGSFLHRLQPIPPPELINARRGSLTGGSNSPVSDRNFSPSGPRPWQNRVSPATTFATPYSGAPTEASTAVGQGPLQGPLQDPPQGAPQAVPQGPPSVGAGGEDEIELQKKIMRERRELAKKRRLEEEAREEAAKKERIRLKLEAMGPPPERKSTKKEGGKEEASPGTPSQSQAQVDPTTTDLQNLPPNRSADSATSAATPGSESKSEALPNGLRPQAGQQQIQQPAPTSSESASSPGQEHKQTQPWQGAAVANQPERLASWGGGNQASTRNVWGAPNNNRSLGNGTFISDLGRVPDAYPSQVSQMQGKPAPGPIGPPVAHKNASAPLAPIGPPKPTPETSTSKNAWVSAVRSSDDFILAQRQAERAEQQREMEARGLAPQEMRTTIKDNWKPTKVSEDGRRIEGKERQTVIHTADSWKARAADDRGQHAQQNATGQKTHSSTAMGPSGSSTGSQARPSRFFPTRDVRQEEAAAAAEIGRPESPSPPPPDMLGHPAFDGDVAHPHVALPPPQIVVRLPPKTQGDVDGSSSQPRWGPPQPFMPPTAGSARVPPDQLQFPPSHPQSKQTDANSGFWQAKFDNLLDRKPNSPPKSALVDSSSGGHHDAVAPLAYASPTVSLPSHLTKNLDTGVDGSITSKVQAEECFEEQEMGSLPPIRLPDIAPDLAWNPAMPPKPVPRRFLVLSPASIDQDAFLRDGFGAPTIVGIRFPGMADGKTVNLPFSRSRSNPRRSNFSRGGPRHASGSGPQRGPKPRDPSSSYSNDHGQSPGPSQSGGNRGRGGFRGRSENWSRHASAPLQT